jgi:hypothetical protein
MIGNRWTELSFLKSFEQVDRRIIKERKSQDSLTLWRKLEKRSDKDVLNHDQNALWRKHDNPRY